MSTAVQPRPHLSASTGFGSSDASRDFGPFRPGERVEDKYDIVVPLGKGAFATVYEAWDAALARPVAIKVVSDDGVELQAEARALAATRNPGVVKVYGFGTHRGYPYLVMELLRGVTLESFLQDRLRQDRPLSPSEVCTLLRGIASILSFVHVLGLVHRDVKPDNVMLCPEGRLVLFDFGLFMPQFQGDRDIGGTPAYMSPEAVLGELACPARDVYSLGAVAYELLTGSPPFDHPDPDVTMFQVVQAEPARLRSIRPDVPGSLARLIAQMLDKDPLRRPSAAELGPRLDDVTRMLRDKAGHREMAILVVDDDEAIVRLLTAFLQARLPGSEVQSARNAEEALERIRGRPPDVLLLDLNMPKTSGVELVMYLRDTTWTEDCMVVSVSAAARDPDVDLLGRLGVVRFVPKGAGMLQAVLHHCLVQRTILDSMTALGSPY